MIQQPFGQPLLPYYSTIENKFKNAFMSCKTFAVHRFIQCEYFFISKKLTSTLEYTVLINKHSWEEIKELILILLKRII